MIVNLVSVFGKTTENLRKKTSVKQINNSKDYVRCVSKPNFFSFQIMILSVCLNNSVVNSRDWSNKKECIHMNTWTVLRRFWKINYLKGLNSLVL